MGGPLPIGGFNGVFGTTATNSFVFQQSFLPRIGTIMKGGTSSFFCYGYTGAGKTHTTLGYGGDENDNDNVYIFIDRWISAPSPLTPSACVSVSRSSAKRNEALRALSRCVCVCVGHLMSPHWHAFDEFPPDSAYSVQRIESSALIPASFYMRTG